jgi:Kef-type K+ transport system membrane component KefB
MSKVWGRLLARVLPVAGLVGCAIVIWSRVATDGTGLPAVDPLARFLLAVAAIVLVCHALGALVRLLWQPPVVGEIAGGLLLGPSVLGVLWPAGRAWLFPAESVEGLRAAAELGLVVFMFLLGWEMRAGHLSGCGMAVTCIVAGAMGLPFALGTGVAFIGGDWIGGPRHSAPAVVVVFGLAVSITALPVLARILVDAGMDRTPVGALALACAAAGDGMTWAALALVLGLVGTRAGDTVTAITLALAFVLVAAVFGRSLMALVVDRLEARPATARLLLPVLIAGALAFAAVTQFVGLHPVIGAFLFGLIVPRGSPTGERVRDDLRGFAVIVLLPLFFARVGMQTSVGTLGSSGAAWLFFGAVLLVAVGGKVVGTVAGARLARIPGPDGLRLGILMNCRGVTELVVASIAYESGVINSFGFTILVLMALVTTMMTGPALRLLSDASDIRRPVEVRQ